MSSTNTTRRGLMFASLALPAASLAGPRRRRHAPPPLILTARGGVENPNLALITVPGPAMDARSLVEARLSGVTALGQTLAGGESFETVVTAIAGWDKAMDTHRRRLLKIEQSVDILRARVEGRIGIILGMTNPAQVGDKLERIDTLAGLGLRFIQLTDLREGAFGDGESAPKNRGLTPLGRKLIERVNGARMILDLSNSAEATCLEAIAVTGRPPSLGRTGCRALTDAPGHKTDAELRGVADKGGFVGIHFDVAADGASRARDVVAHIDYAVNLCGEDHVGLGSGFDITVPDNHTPGADSLRGPGQFHRLHKALAARGHTPRRIDKILGRNYLAFARQVWGA